MTRQSEARHVRVRTSEKMLNLRKQIDFNLLGDDGDAVNKMDLDDYFSEETSPSPPAFKLAKIPLSRVYQRRRSFDETNQNSPPCTPLSRSQARVSPYPNPGYFTTPEASASRPGYFTSPSPTQPQERVSRVFSKPVKKSLSKISPDKSDSLDVSRKLPKSVNT